jgi:DNA-3-methyladenine glycosylase II
MPVEQQESEVHEFLRSACDVMESLIREHGHLTLEARPDDEYFEILTSTIVGQQLSAKAARTITQRVKDLSGELSHEAVHQITFDDLRSCGLSTTKAKSIKNLADKFTREEIPFHSFTAMSSDEITHILVQEPGIGAWTVEMFLIEALAHEDVWSIGDMALRKAVRNSFGDDVDIDDVALRWQPYRSIASLYLWKTIDG